VDILDRELTDIVDAIAPPLIDIDELKQLEQLERLVTEDDLLSFGGECLIHDGCRPVFARRDGR
jgi:hypothetical protein